MSAGSALRNTAISCILIVLQHNPCSTDTARAVSRRGFIAALAMAAPALALPSAALAGVSVSRALKFAHTHTGEHLAVEYFSAGRYLPTALSEVNRFLRDFRTGEVHRIDPALLDFLNHLRRTTGYTGEFEVISGYRSPHTNAALRGRSNGVAARSLHMDGRAIDIRAPGLKLTTLRDAALDARLGGVGFYPGSNFVHVDTGRVRRW
jgi:uncharacterized protein YcbK (DUF882 family)